MGLIDLYYLDESGFAPTLPTGYTWARKKVRPLVWDGPPQGRRLNVLGALAPCGDAPGLVWTERPQESFLVSVSVVIALTFTAYGAWVIFVRHRRPGNAFLLIQALVDLGVVTTIVHFAGQPQSAFPALYVLVSGAWALNTLYERPLESFGGTLIVLLGVPGYLYWKRTNRKLAA